MKTLAVWAVSFAMVGFHIASSATIEKPTEAELIDQLGNDSFDRREEASRLLVDREESIPALRLALTSADGEIRRRAGEILREIEVRQAKRGLDKAVSLLKSGDIDQAVERLVWWAEEDPNGNSLEEVTRLAAKLLEWRQHQFGKPKILLTDGLPAGELAAYIKSSHPVFLSSWHPIFYRGDYPLFVLRAPGIIAPAKFGGLIVSSANVVSDRLYPSIVISTGSVTINDCLVQSVIVSDEDIMLEDCDDVVDCIIIARGNVTLRREPRHCGIFAGGSIRLKGRPYFADSVLCENEPNALGLVKFFDPAKAGIEVVAAKVGVEVKVVGKNAAFAAAGIEPGDILVDLSGKPVNSPETFRRLLRTALAEGNPFTIAGRRGEKAMEFTVKARD